MFTKIKKEKGFSLVELLIYVAGMVILISVLVMMIIQIYGIYKEVTVGPRADRVGLIAVDRILKDVRSGQNIDLGNSILNSNDGVLSLVSKENGSTIEKVYSLENDRIIYRENIETIGMKFLSPSDIKVTKLEFKHLTSPISEGIRVDIDITYTSGDQELVKEFNGFAILRQSYE